MSRSRRSQILRLKQRMRTWGHDILMRIATTGKRYGVRAHEKLTAFVELQAAIRACGEVVNNP